MHPITTRYDRVTAGNYCWDVLDWLFDLNRSLGSKTEIGSIRGEGGFKKEGMIEKFKNYC